MAEFFHVVSMDAFLHKCINRVSELRRLWNILHAYETYLCLYENYIHGFDIIFDPRVSTRDTASIDNIDDISEYIYIYTNIFFPTSAVKIKLQLSLKLSNLEMHIMNAKITTIFLHRSIYDNNTVFCWLQLYDSPIFIGSPLGTNHITGLILGLRPASESRRYKETPSPIGWAQT